MKPAQATSAQALLEQLEQLRQRRADAFDPVRFRYLEAMTKRAAGLNPRVSAQVLHKVAEALQAYRAELARQREQAAALAASIAVEFPDSKAAAQQLLQGYQFRRLRALQARLQRNSGERESVILGSLFGGAEAVAEIDTANASFDDVLRQQERELLANFAADSPGARQPGARQPGALLHTERRELKSTRRVRESLVKRNADKLVTRALQEAPENPGPLNPQMLAIRSLSAMRDLSPHYLTRFVSYTETLLWLEQAGIATATEKPGKSPRKARTKRNPTGAS